MGDALNVSEMLDENAFNDVVMKNRLPKGVYKKLKKAIEDGAELDPSIADVVTHVMKGWATERGATHYTHWFQLLIGVTTEKHDSSISAPSDGRVIMEFSGKELIKGKPDASSLPSDDLRATFEARGYTVWDCTSSTSLWGNAIGVILHIPAPSCSYKGKALDRKTPLLRPMQAVNERTLRILRLFDNVITKRAAPSVGVEQECFPVDRGKYLRRRDLIYAGRTLFGAIPPKSQELEGHYFGAICERIGPYMNDVNKESQKLGTPAKTRHNEVVPAQHELVPIYEGVDQAVDHNQIVMKALKKVVGRHGMACLPHEKPFAGADSSGKHDSWSLTGNDSTNLLSPGDMPHENIQFLLVLVCIIKAADIHAGLLRESTSDVRNDRGLGASEVSPAVIPIFLGEQLEDVIDQLCSTGEATHSKQGGTSKTDVDVLPDLNKDATDRNRTSPFTFAGNKFESHMVGSPDSIASLNTTLSTIAAEAFKEVTDMLGKTEGFDMAVYGFIKETLVTRKRITFNGNGYSDEQVARTERKGPPNIRSMVGAIPVPTMDKAVKLFEAFGVSTRAELEPRSEVKYENYSEAINIEARIVCDMASRSAIPVVIKYTTRLAPSIAAVKGIYQEADVSTWTGLLTETSKLLAEIRTAFARLLEVTKKAAATKDDKVRALVYYSQMVPTMEALGAPMNQLEMIVDKELWSVSSYGDLIFEV